MDTPPDTNAPTIDTSGHDGLLTFVLVDEDSGQDDHYAIVPFPKTYEDAKRVAIQALGEYMGTDKPDIMLRRSLRNRKREWVWADILPAYWEATVTPDSTEIGVFLRDPDLAGDPLFTTFVHGPVHLTWCWDEGQGIQWESIDLNTLPSLHRWGKAIDRPETYESAVNAARTKLNEITMFNPVGFTVPQKIGESDTFTFCTFQDANLFSWVPMPPEVCKDVSLWQEFVPAPGGILGVIINKRV